MAFIPKQMVLKPKEAVLSPKELVEKSRKSFQSGSSKFLHFRKRQLEALLKLLEENKLYIFEALHKDLRKSKLEAYSTEIQFLIEETKYFLKEFNNLTKPEIPERMRTNMFDKLEIIKEPYGVVLIIASWSYPFRYCLLPLIGAITSGNTAIIKPSKTAPNSAEVIAELIRKYLDKECYQVFLGGEKETKELLKERFDYVFFTGSSSVGKQIYSTCSQNLTPVTLELGGKNPVYLHESTDMEVATRRILWGKFLNAGQSCTAPDYLLCKKSVQRAFLEEASLVIKRFFGENPKMSPDFGRIVSDEHFLHLQRLLVGKEIAVGGRTDVADRYIEPTILINVNVTDPVKQEEIFGPILPIVYVETMAEAIKFINARERPLALYIFSNDEHVTDSIVKNTYSGGVTVNDVLGHTSCDALPYGGVGKSGTGQYHGKETFETFCHKKGVLTRDFKRWKENQYFDRYPPSNEEKFKRYLEYGRKRKMVSFKYVPHVIVFVVGMFLLFALWSSSGCKKNNNK